MKSKKTALNPYKKSAISRVFFTLFVIVIYLIGSNIMLPGIDASQLMKLLAHSPSLSFALSATGFSINQLTLFSLGLGPWMSAMILWRVLSVVKVFNIESLTQKQSYQMKFLFSLLLGGIQSFSILLQVQMIGVSEKQSYFVILLMILLAGLSILVWLGNLNSERGIGGATIIVLVNMMRTWPERLIKAIPQTQNVALLSLKILLGLFVFLLISYAIFRFYQGELRLKRMYVMLNNSYHKQSYLPIPINPGGGMPFMYAFSVMLFPQYLLFILQKLYPSQQWIERLYQELQLSHFTGVLLLILSVMILSYGFAYMNIDYKDIAENMKKSGDYFSGVYPGKNTEKYLFHKLSYMATISAICNGLIIGLPMILALFWKSMGIWAYFVSTWFILMFLVYEIKVQFTSMYHRNSYKAFIASSEGSKE